MKKKTNFLPKEYDYLLTALLKEIENTPKLRPDREEWDVEGSWQDCGDIHFVDSRYMHNFALWRDFGCKTIKLINYGRAAVRMNFFSKHKYWLKKPQDLSEDERSVYLTEYTNNLHIAVRQLQERLDLIPPLARAEARIQISTVQQEIEQWQQVIQESTHYELAISTYQRGYAYLYISYKFRLPNGEYDNESNHLLHHTRDRIGNITQRKQNIVFINVAEISRVHPYQNKEIENYLNNFPIKSSTGPKWLYARQRAVTEGQKSFDLPESTGDDRQLDLFDRAGIDPEPTTKARKK